MNDDPRDKRRIQILSQHDPSGRVLAHVVNEHGEAIRCLKKIEQGTALGDEAMICEARPDGSMTYETVGELKTRTRASTPRYREGWDRIFGARAPGQA
jgi:hypothetical protein